MTLALKEIQVRTRMKRILQIKADIFGIFAS